MTRIGPERNYARCVLCGKGRERVQNMKLILGMHGGVCLECVELCNEIIRHDAARPEVSFENEVINDPDAP